MQNLAYERSHGVLTFYIFFLPLPSPIRGWWPHSNVLQYPNEKYKICRAPGAGGAGRERICSRAVAVLPRHPGRCASGGGSPRRGHDVSRGRSPSGRRGQREGAAYVAVCVQDGGSGTRPSRRREMSRWRVWPAYSHHHATPFVPELEPPRVCMCHVACDRCVSNTSHHRPVFTRNRIPRIPLEAAGAHAHAHPRTCIRRNMRPAIIFSLLWQAQGLMNSPSPARLVRHHSSLGSQAKLRSSPSVAMYAGEDYRKRGLLSKAAIPAGVAPWQFYTGFAAFLLANFGVVGIVIAGRLFPDKMPPINALTDIANVAMQEGVDNGTLQPMVATLWAQGLFGDMLGQFFAAGVPGPVFIQQWCESDATHTSWCTVAKAAAETRSASGL
jgi:hypothetical protein